MTRSKRHFRPKFSSDCSSKFCHISYL